MVPMLLAIGPGVAIPLMLGLPALLGALWQSWRSSEVARQATQPGGLPGTGGPAPGYYPAGTQGMIETGAQYDPRIAILPAQYEENRAARARQADFLDRIVKMMEGSPLGELAETVGGWRESFGEFASGVEGAEGQDPFSQRMQRYEERRTDLTSRIQALNREVQGKFRETIADPTIMTQQEMDAIVGRYMAGSREAAGQRMRGLEGEAGARGLSPAAVASLRQQVAAQQRRENLAAIASVADINAARRAELGQRATEMLGAVGGDLYSREAGVSGMYDEMTDRLLRTAMPWLVGTEAGLTQTYEDRLAGSLLDRASLEQPENLAIIGEILAQRGDYNTLLESGAAAELANTLAGLGGAGLEFASGSLDRAAMGEYMNQSDFPWNLFQLPLALGTQYGISWLPQPE